MIGTKNTTLIVAPRFYQNNTALKKMIFANIVIDLNNKKHKNTTNDQTWEYISYYNKNGFISHSYTANQNKGQY